MTAEVGIELAVCGTCGAAGAVVVQVFLPGQIGIPDPTLACEGCIGDAAQAGGVVARLHRPRHPAHSSAGLDAMRKRFRDQTEQFPTGF